MYKRKYNWELSIYPDFWKRYEWGNEIYHKNGISIVENRDRFIDSYNIDTNRDLHPSYIPEGYSSGIFSIPGNGASGTGEVFYIKDCDYMIMVISIYNTTTSKFLLEGWTKLSYPLCNRSKTYYKIAPEKYIELADISENDDIF